MFKGYEKVLQAKKEFYTILENATLYGKYSGKGFYDQLSKCLNVCTQVSLTFPDVRNPHPLWTQLTKEMYAIAMCYSDFKKPIHDLFKKEIFDIHVYGTIQKNFVAKVKLLKEADILAKMSDIEKCIIEKRYLDLWSFPLEDIRNALWYFMLNEPFDVNKYERIYRLYKRILPESFSGMTYIEMTILEMFHQKVNNEPVEFVFEHDLNSFIDTYEINKQYPNYYNNRMPSTNYYLEHLASALKWLKLLDQEKKVLECLRKAAKHPSEHLMERLSLLEKISEKEKDYYSVNDDLFSFDVSALHWKEQDVEDFYTCLETTEKQLNYRVALHEQSTFINLASIVSIDTNALSKSMLCEMQNEYGDIIHVSCCMSKSMYHNTCEDINGILVTCDECEELSLFVYIQKLGKKLNITIYSLFNPLDADLCAQKGKMLSLLHRSSPSIRIWETSLQESILLSIQKVLNNNNIEAKKNINEVIF